MERTDIDPRMFGQRLGYNRAVLVEQPRRWLLVSGHESRAADGTIAHEGNVRAQIGQTFEELAKTLAKADFTLKDVVQIRIFTTDIAQMTKNYDAVTEALAAADCRPASTMVQVGALSDPKMLLEIEAVAVQ